MAAYLIRRLWQMIPTLAGVILLVFFLFKWFGGDPAEVLAGLNATQEQVKAIRQTLGLAVPIVVGQVSQVLMGVTDSVMIGRIGKVPLAASAFAGGVFNLIFIGGLGMLLAVSVLV